jgi:hypothetical protein
MVSTSTRASGSTAAAPRRGRRRSRLLPRSRIVAARGAPADPSPEAGRSRDRYATVVGESRPAERWSCTRPHDDHDLDPHLRSAARLGVFGLVVLQLDDASHGTPSVRCRQQNLSPALRHNVVAYRGCFVSTSRSGGGAETARARRRGRRSRSRRSRSRRSRSRRSRYPRSNASV